MRRLCLTTLIAVPLVILRPTGAGAEMYSDFPPGIPMHLKATVVVVDEKGIALPNEVVYTAETMSGLMRTITGELRADASGEIHLDGYYCTPMTIVTYGSDVAIRGDSRYTLVRKDNGAHPFVLLGEPYEEIWKNLDKMRKNCR